MQSLLSKEKLYLPSSNYLSAIQGEEIEECTRFAVVEWLNEVNTEDPFPDALFLTINCFDRVLSKMAVAKDQLQPLAMVCYHIAYKYYDAVGYAIEAWVDVMDGELTTNEFKELELKVLDVLEWKISSVSIYDFLHQIREDVGIDDGIWNDVRERAEFYVEMSTYDYSLL